MAKLASSPLAASVVIHTPLAVRDDHVVAQLGDALIVQEFLPSVVVLARFRGHLDDDGRVEERGRWLVVLVAALAASDDDVGVRIEPGRRDMDALVAPSP